jgi:hypothetical protein
MGRYWDTNTGRSGKFGFGCQSSTDPKDYFGMEECEPTSITYYADDRDIDRIKSKLDEIYDKANVPEKERIYCLSKDLSDNNSEYEDFHKRYHKYFFETCEAGEGNFAGENNTTEREVFDNAHLCQSRLWLGLSILSDINQSDYCSLDAEL